MTVLHSFFDKHYPLYITNYIDDVSTEVLTSELANMGIEVPAIILPANDIAGGACPKCECANCQLGPSNICCSIKRVLEVYPELHNHPELLL